jgi:hypothetical protein
MMATGHVESVRQTWKIPPGPCTNVRPWTNDVCPASLLTRLSGCQSSSGWQCSVYPVLLVIFTSGHRSRVPGSRLITRIATEHIKSVWQTWKIPPGLRVNVRPSTNGMCPPFLLTCLTDCHSGNGWQCSGYLVLLVIFPSGHRLRAPGSRLVMMTATW